MSRFSAAIGSQFGNPHGFVGSVCCLIMNVVNHAMYRRTVALVSVTAGERILDIGYGNGHLLKKLYRKTRADLYGIDISSDMRELAERKNKDALVAGKLHLSIGDCCALPYEDAFFSAVTSINTVYFWSDLDTGLSEIHRVLKAGGSFFNIVYSKEWLDTLSYTRSGFLKYAPQELIDAGKRAGFADVRLQTIASGKSFAVIYRK